MDDYNFWQDAFDTYQSLSDGLKLAWLALPPTFLLALMALILRFRHKSRLLDANGRGDLIYTIYRDDDSTLAIYRHDRRDNENLLIVEEATTDNKPWQRLSSATRHSTHRERF